VGGAEEEAQAALVEDALDGRVNAGVVAEGVDEVLLGTGAPRSVVDLGMGEGLDGAGEDEAQGIGEGLGGVFHAGLEREAADPGGGAAHAGAATERRAEGNAERADDEQTDEEDDGGEDGLVRGFGDGGSGRGGERCQWRECEGGGSGEWGGGDEGLDGGVGELEGGTGGEAEDDAGGGEETHAPAEAERDLDGAGGVVVAGKGKEGAAEELGEAGEGEGGGEAEQGGGGNGAGAGEDVGGESGSAGGEGDE